MSSEKKSITNIQILRGLAALSIVVKHAADQFGADRFLARIDGTQAGVDLFFVISGFIMVYVTTTRRQNSGEFFLNRLVRIVPNYWFYTFVTALLAIVIPSVFRATTFGFGHLALSMFFIAHPNPANPQSASPLLRLGWTLNYEMFFYVLFTISLLWKKHRIAIAASAITALVTIGFFVPAAHLVPYFYTRPIMLEFVYGMLLAGLYFKELPQISLPVLGATSLVAGGVLFAFAARVSESNFERAIFFGLPAFAIVMCGVLAEHQSSRFQIAPLRKLGDASYTLYLCHPFLLTTCRAVAVRTHLVPHSMAEVVIFMISAGVAASFMGYWAYLWIELPVTKFAKRYADGLTAIVKRKSMQNAQLSAAEESKNVAV